MNTEITKTTSRKRLSVRVTDYEYKNFINYSLDIKQRKSESMNLLLQEVIKNPLITEQFNAIQLPKLQDARSLNLKIEETYLDFIDTQISFNFRTRTAFVRKLIIYTINKDE